MAAMWPLSRTKEYDINGDPIVGAEARFYDVNTLTPQPVYSDAALSDVLDQPVETDGYGRWPAVYLNTDPGTYRQRVYDASSSILFDDDNISVPLGATYTPPDAGETSAELLFSTGMLIPWYGTGAKAGWVRAAGRTIGSGSSGATERANADCSALFLFLWTADANLSVSGGRGANAAADFAANKTIALPDYRDRVIVGLGDMGNSDANRIADALTSSTNITLGATAGASTVILTAAQLAAHSHTASFTGEAMGTHTHNMDTRDDSDGGQGTRVSNTNTPGGAATIATGAASAGTPAGTVTVNNSVGDEAHPNLQPGMFASIYIKL